MSEISLFAGDNRETMRRMIDEGTRVHSVVTDPPYGLVSIQKRFGKAKSKGARTEGNDGSFARLSGGFMGKAWDGTGIERDPDFWKLVYDILLPGGFVFAFSGSRTGHWQACAMEMAGFIMHPMHGWVFGSGFPKAHNASRAIDKHLGADRKVLGSQKAPGFAKSNVDHGQQGRSTYDFPVYDKNSVSPEAQEWDGWAYGTQSQKPAIEPIYLAQKPFSEKTGAKNILMHGVGAFNIDGCRVKYLDDDDKDSARPQGEATSRIGALAGKSQGGNDRTNFEISAKDGRHPANLILDGSPEVVEMFPTSNVTGKRTDASKAARFFHQFPPDMNPLFYHPKAGKADRAGSKHPTVKPIALMQYLIRHITPKGGTVLDPFAGSGTTAQAAINEGFDCIMMEAEQEYVDFLTERFDLGGDLGLDLLDSINCDDQFKDILG